MVDDIEFRDEGEYSEEKKYSIKEIILRHIKKISDLCCKEFTGGYWEKKPIKTPSGVMFSEVYHNDVRESYCNAVDFLVDIIYPMGDKDLQDYLKENEDYGDKETEEETDVKKKLKKKRRTFRQINLMFERKDFWKGIESYNE